MSMLEVVTPGKCRVTEWDPNDATQVAAMREEFDTLMASGLIGFADGKLSETFDPNAETMLVTTVVVAG